MDFLISFCLMIAMMVWYQFPPGWPIARKQRHKKTGSSASLGPSLLIATLNVKYRDFRFVIPFIVQFGLYVSPVGSSSNIVPEQWRLLYSLNPIVGAIDGFRWCLLDGQNHLYLPGLALSSYITALFLWFGIRQFRKMERGSAYLI